MDLERFRLRRFLERLPAEELERVGRPVELADVAACLEGNPRAVWFSSAGGAELAGNVAASRSRLALALATEPKHLLAEVRRRLGVPQEVVEVDDAPVQQVVETQGADLTALPVHLQHGFDGAPYISSAMDVTRDPASGLANVGIRRLMLRGRREAGVDLNAPSDLRAIYQVAAQRGERLPIAFAVGSHPADHVAATMRVPGDELGLIARLRGAPLAVAKCVTSDLRVPADAEYVLEGYLDERGYVEPEGPYGEFLGYYGALKTNPVFHLTAITRRRDALFQTSTISGRTLARTDTAQLNALRAEVTAWRALESAVREIRAVYATPAGGGAFNMRVALRPRVPGEARNAIAAVLGCLANVKHVFVVDEDIDVYSDEQMEWALATRFQAARDLVVLSALRAMPLDPSLRGERTSSKAGFDLTLPLATRRGLETLTPEPPRYEGRRFDSVDAALADGPKFFVELMSARGSRDGREIVRELEALRATGGLARDEEGRYVYRPPGTAS
ncbi:MAG TPA: UbiD family decarboxylase [Burkholderiales bacterium]|nr:UbiD family decarboxylase [Burkholderiales bacterium]